MRRLTFPKGIGYVGGPQEKGDCPKRQSFRTTNYGAREDKGPI